MSKLDLEQQRKRAKDLKRAYAAGDAAAAERIARNFPEPKAITLADAQLVIAREAGYASWPAMVHAVRDGDSIHGGAAAGDLDRVRAWLARDASVADVRGGDRDWTPLLYACCGRGREAERVAIARELLAHGADPDALGREPGYTSANTTMFDEYEWLPLEGAAGRVGSAELVELLHASGADASKTTTLLARAVQSGRADVVRAARAAKPPAWQAIWALCACVELDAPVELARLLVADLEQPKWREPALLDAIRLHRDAALVDVLLGDVEIPGWRAGYRAATRFDHAGARALLERRGITDAVLTPADRAIAAALHGEPAAPAAFTQEDHRVLAWAIRTRRFAAVPRLLALGLDPDVADKDGETPLHLAARAAHQPTIEALLAAGARRDARNYDARTPFDSATSTTAADPARFERAADAVAFGDADTLRALLASEPALVHARSPRPHRATLLHYCAANGTEDPRQRTPDNAAQIAEILLAAGADPDATCRMYRGGTTTLGLMLTSAIPRAAGLDGALVEVLARYGARITRDDLVTAIAYGLPRSVAAIVAAGVPVADLYTAGGTNDVPKLRMLLAAGADPNARDRDGATALHAAATMGHVEAARVLLEHGADRTLREDSWGGTAADGARYFGHAELAALLG